MRRSSFFTILAVVQVLLVMGDARAEPPTPTVGAPIAFGGVTDEHVPLCITAQSSSCTTPCTLTLAPGSTHVVAKPPGRAPWEVDVAIPPGPARVHFENTGNVGYFVGPVMISLGVADTALSVYLVAAPKEEIAAYRPVVKAFGVLGILIGAAGIGGGIFMLVDADKNKAVVTPTRSSLPRFVGGGIVPVEGGQGAATTLIGVF
jgi:hypothetical protein